MMFANFLLKLSIFKYCTNNTSRRIGMPKFTSRELTARNKIK